MTLRRATLAAVKLIHTFAWFSIESCMIYVLGQASGGGPIAVSQSPQE